MNARANVVTIYLPITPAMRARLEATIDALVELLDAVDGEPDLEPDADAEPWLGWHYTDDGETIAAGPAGDDREDDDGDEDGDADEDGGDDEVSDCQLGD